MPTASYNTVNATGPAILSKSNLNVPSRVSSPAALRAIKENGNTPNWAASLAKDIESLSLQTNGQYQSLTQTPQSIDQILITNNSQGQIVAAIGDFIYEGQYFANFFNEIHVCDPSLQNNPGNAVFNANIDGSVTIGGSGWLDVLDPFGGIAAYIGTQQDTVAITGAADNGSGLIRLTVPGHTLITGNTAQVRNMQNAGVPNATGTWVVTVIDSSHVDLQGSVFAGTFVAPPVPFGINTTSPTIDRVLQISAVASSAGLIEITTSIAHTYQTGDRVNIPVLPGVPNGVGQFTITVVSTTQFTLNGSTFGGSYTSGGTCLRFFAGGLFQTIAIGPSFQNYNLRGFADGSLKINNATIQLSSSAGSIVLDPTGPDILFTNTTNAAAIQIGSNPPLILIKDLTGATVAQLGVNSGGHGVLVLNGPIINGGTYTGGYTANLTGITATSVINVVSGQITGFTP
jgi:hypothetical protein